MLDRNLLTLFVFFFPLRDSICVGAFSRFLPTLPYPFASGDNSPPISAHSPPAGVAMTNLPVTPTVLRPQPQLPATAVSIAAATASHLSNGCSPSILSPLRIRVSSPNRINSDLTSIVHQQHGLSNASVISNQQQHRTNGIVRIVAGGGNANPTAGSLTSSMSSICSAPPPTLHRPFSPSPQPKDVS